MAAETQKKGIPLYGRIFIALGIGIAFGYVLNMMGGTHNPIINGYILPFLQFLGDFFIKLIKMVVVPLVFFCIVDAALSLGDINKLKSVGVTTIIWFLATGMISAMIGLFWVNLIQPGKGLQLGTVSGGVKAKELPGMYQTILDFIPSNPFESLTSGSMMQIIVFSLFIGFAIIALGKKAEPLGKIFNMLSMVMFKIVDYVIAIIPVGVFGLMSTTMTKYGTAIFGPVLKFILTDYLACLTTTFGVYTLLLAFVARVNVVTFWKKAFPTWLIAFSTCTSSAALPVSMDIAPNKMGAPKDISSFILPLGCTAQMNGTCAYFAVVILFAAQLYGVDFKPSSTNPALCTGNLPQCRVCSHSADRPGHQFDSDDTDGTSAGWLFSGRRDLPDRRSNPYSHQLGGGSCGNGLYFQYAARPGSQEI